MKHATAVRRLRQIAEDAPKTVWPDQDPVLLEIYTFGPIFDDPGDVDAVDLALVLDAPDALNALSEHDTDRLRLPAPPPADYEEQLAVELDAAWHHLQHVRDQFWERDWRREHKAGFGVYPETHLWNAVWGYTSLRESIDR